MNSALNILAIGLVNIVLGAIPWLALAMVRGTFWYHILVAIILVLYILGSVAIMVKAMINT